MEAVTPSRLKISDRAHLVLDMHRMADGKYGQLKYHCRGRIGISIYNSLSLLGHQEEQRNKSNVMLGTVSRLFFHIRFYVNFYL